MVKAYEFYYRNDFGDKYPASRAEVNELDEDTYVLATDYTALEAEMKRRCEKLVAVWPRGDQECSCTECCDIRKQHAAALAIAEGRDNE